MANIRAYKLAEELGIERHEFVDRAAEVGVELKNAMAALDDAQVTLLREKLGQPDRAARQMVERRVESKQGTTVLRRRKRAEPEPEPASAEEMAESTAVVDEPSQELVDEPALEEPGAEEVAAQEPAAPPVAEQPAHAVLRFELPVPIRRSRRHVAHHQPGPHDERQEQAQPVEPGWPDAQRDRRREPLHDRDHRPVAGRPGGDLGRAR